jgi:hypothetical protein
MMTIHMRCPVDGSSSTWPEHDADLAWKYWHYARRHQITITRLCKMAIAKMWGAYWIEIDERQHQADQDAEQLKRPMSAEQALKIWQRNLEGLRWLAEQIPEKRAEIGAVIAKRRAAMKRLRKGAALALESRRRSAQ